MAASASEKVLLGQFGAAHGIRGEIKLASYTDAPLGIADYGPFTLDDGRVVEILGLRMQGDSIIARVKGVIDRNAAETLRNRKLFVERSALPELEEEDDFYHADLVGLRAELEDGTLYGKVISVQNFGAGDLLEIEPVPAGRSFYVPFTRAIVPTVDVKGGKLVVVPPPEVEVREDDAAGEEEA
ncbi:ribosome maturation factor RimM [Kaistia dalseonensis]|uniref:Ribosome maturation factor RimM n=1 Tax=Kaistia dalseonensis TaxID=410840 RepID=A0ABU0H4N4_9HYPH|nr:ribosome maturation factor RimM [Kaistia dalseonensis]MCX5494689.1 ribosome maturation factor RimM [Kaistia dalseonensis]MDQ0437270.1 16S rRNA processing protein RimM [Kaistia dalseonensis]